MPSPAKPTASFNTITGADWKRSIATARATPNYVALQIIAHQRHHRMKNENTRAALILEVAHLVFDEMKRQDDKFGPARVQSEFKWNTILFEEVGEVAEETLNQGTKDAIEEIDRLGRLEKEIVQVAAVATQYAAAIREQKLKLQSLPQS